jgi:hypothetical protein
MSETPEQQARDLLEDYGLENAQSFSAGDVVELANLIADARAYRRLQRLGLRVEEGADFTGGGQTRYVTEWVDDVPVPTATGVVEGMMHAEEQWKAGHE